MRYLLILLLLAGCDNTVYRAVVWNEKKQQIHMGTYSSANSCLQALGKLYGFPERTCEKETVQP